ncbi:Sulfoxide reductase heme-binding subunit YedZ [Roseovarius litorisediminis]|uniref:Protein-methionine-sulfoxide reductase heme-binding subunit MsrQ n=1 Tax=Roseovarius litorisediminis TaxID=1312363 RepID=A0A1Y5RVY5_9RHOB|nr:protein-methionine-sulfoxide reductase heme-binding subunit MsrQ [Roseovarius litorisediminis]SLN26329.1 Sulfoxide reductase heme-binding subunit YedZ [Roseovarius litorisediminis]
MGPIDGVNAAARRMPAWPLYIIGVLPAIWLVWLGATGGLGAEPIKALERGLGEKALQLLVLVLAITPLRRFVGLNLLKFRRAIGLLVFIYAALHLLVWLVLDVQIPAQIWADIVKRPYVTIGFTGFLLLVPLAMTSNNWSVRRLGPKWRQLHRLTYVAAALGGVHYIWLVKGIQIEPLAYMAVILGLLALRKRGAPRKQAG